MGTGALAGLSAAPLLLCKMGRGASSLKRWELHARPGASAAEVSGAQVSAWHGKTRAQSRSPCRHSSCHPPRTQSTGGCSARRKFWGLEKPRASNTGCYWGWAPPSRAFWHSKPQDQIIPRHKRALHGRMRCTSQQAPRTLRVPWGPAGGGTSLQEAAQVLPEPEGPRSHCRPWASLRADEP